MLNYSTQKNMVEAVCNALSASIHFLGRRQDPAGAWPDFLMNIGYSTAWTTAYTALALTRVPETVPDWTATVELISKARLWLLANIHPRGGWGYHGSLPPDADSTSMALRLFNRLGAKEASALRLGSFRIYGRNPDGGVGAYNWAEVEAAIGSGNPFTPTSSSDRWAGWCSSTVSITAVSLLAWLSSNVKRSSPAVSDALRYLYSRRNADGSWNDYWWKSAHYPTMLAVSALLEAGEPVAQVESASAWLLETQREDGGWGQAGESDPFATGAAIQTLIAAGCREHSRIDRAVQRLLSMQAPDGGYVSSAIMQVPAGDMVEVPTGLEFPMPQRVAHVLDHRRCFTTATAVEALSEYVRQRYY